MSDVSPLTATQLDEIAHYNGAKNKYELAKDPRCLWGWGPPTGECRCRFGHACFRPLGHRGRCWDSGEPPRLHVNPRACETAQRPKRWDTELRTEANR